MPARRNPLVLALLCAVAVAAAGCGADSEGGDGPSSDTQVRAVVARFGVATRTHDYQTICDDLLADELVAKIETIGLPCESALSRGLGDVKNPTLTINQVSIAGARALVSIHTTATGQPSSDDALQVVRESGRWKIASLASPSGGSSTTPTTTETTPTTPATTTATTSKRRSRSGTARRSKGRAGKRRSHRSP